MSIWDSVTASDAQAFTDPDALGGEPVVYTPRGGAARTIYAIVERHVPESLAPSSPLFAKMTVHVRNSATTGISSAELNTGGDRLTVAERKGGTPKEFQLHLPVDSPADFNDSGMLRLECR